MDRRSRRRDPNAWETTTALYASWKTWADHAGEHPGTMKRFVQNTEARGLTPERKKDGRASGYQARFLTCTA